MKQPLPPDENGMAGFWDIWKSHRNRLYLYCLNLLNGVEMEAQDALSGTLLKAVDFWESGRQVPENPGGWLFRIAHNYCMDVHRHAARQARTGADPDQWLARDARSFPAVEESPEEGLLRREMHFNLETALRKMPDRLQNVMVLLCLREQSYKEIAAQLQLTEVNVRKRVQQGRAWIREYMEGYQKGNLGSSPQSPEDVGVVEARLNREVKGESLEKPRFSGSHGWLLAPEKENFSAPQVIYSHLSPRRFEQKRNAAEKYVKKYPGGWKKRLELGYFSLLSGNWLAALRHWNWVHERHPHLLEPVLALARLHLAQEDRKSAVEWLKNGLQQTRNPGFVHYLEGLLALITRQFVQAVRALNKAKKFLPEEFAISEPAIQALLAMKEYRRAFGAWQTVPEDMQTPALLVLRYEIEQNLETGAFSLENALLRFPQDPMLLSLAIRDRLSRELLRGKEGTLTRAFIRDLQKVSSNPNLGLAFQAAYLYFRNDIHKARHLLEEGVKNSPQDLSLLHNQKWLEMHHQAQLPLHFQSVSSPDLPSFCFPVMTLF